MKYTLLYLKITIMWISVNNNWKHPNAISYSFTLFHLIIVIEITVLDKLKYVKLFNALLNKFTYLFTLLYRICNSLNTNMPIIATI